MRKLILYMTTTLDGFIAGPNGESYGEEPSHEEHTFGNALFAAADTILFGRTTYEGFVAYWDTLDLTDPANPAIEVEFARLFRTLKRVVFSRTLHQAGPHTTLIKENIAAEVRQLKQQPGKDLLLVCGPELLATLVQAGLVDEFQLMITPTVLGKGKSLFGGLSTKLKLELLATRVFASGSVLHCYRPGTVE